MNALLMFPDPHDDPAQEALSPPFHRGGNLRSRDENLLLVTELDNYSSSRPCSEHLNMLTQAILPPAL